MSDESERVVTEEDDREDVAVDHGADVDAAAESFLDLEEDLASPAGDRVRGRAVDVERVPAGEVPPGYPVTITTSEALALTLELAEGTETTVYFEFEDGIADERLSRLLDLHDVPPERFGDLHGESILLVAEDGHHVPYVPAGGHQGSRLGVYGVGAGLGMNLLVFLLSVVGLGSLLTVPVVVAWLLANVVGLPIATYLDARYLRTHTDWEQGPGFWATLAAIPGVNVASSLAYLWTRRQSTEL